MLQLWNLNVNHLVMLLFLILHIMPEYHEPEFIIILPTSKIFMIIYCPECVMIFLKKSKIWMS